MELSFRRFVEGDEGVLVELWNRAHAQYGGYFRKSVERWRWIILQWRAVPPDSIILSTLAGRVVAYSILDMTGDVLEFTVAPELEPRLKRAASRGLVERVEDRGREIGCESVSFEIPSTDRAVADVLYDEGYATLPASQFGLVPGVLILNPARLIDGILSHPNHRLPAAWTRRIVIDTPPGGYAVSPQTRTLITVERGLATAVDASDELPVDFSWRFQIDLTTLTELMFGLLEVDQAVQDRRLVLPTGCTSADARTLFSALTIRADWYTPPSDLF